MFKSETVNIIRHKPDNHVNSIFFILECQRLAVWSSLLIWTSDFYFKSLIFNKIRTEEKFQDIFPVIKTYSIFKVLSCRWDASRNKQQNIQIPLYLLCHCYNIWLQKLQHPSRYPHYLLTIFLLSFTFQLIPDRPVVDPRFTYVP